MRRSSAQRKRLALEAKRRGVDAVARQAGVEPGTVRVWRAEFGVGIGTRGSSQAAAAPGHEVDLLEAAACGLDDFADSNSIQEMGGLVKKAGDALSCELSAWLGDADSRELASKRLGEVISDWEAEHGAVTAEELDEARAQLFG
ncbi:hypothetical protein [Candidatus Poriferisocius sp.]|uniref:hypothetical protein n=1 Tax=Candidatus Poriferisocius sp. TaxID=3101276 RepID=UPI003B5299E1